MFDKQPPSGNYQAAWVRRLNTASQPMQDPTAPCATPRYSLVLFGLLMLEVMGNHLPRRSNRKEQQPSPTLRNASAVASIPNKNTYYLF